MNRRQPRNPAAGSVMPHLIFLKYISDAFEEHRQWLLKEAANPKSDYYVREREARYRTVEDRDEYVAENVFWVPKEAGESTQWTG